MKKIWIDTVSIGQEISIQGEKYICRGISLCESDSNYFCEFMLYSKNQNTNMWLEVELVNNVDYEFCLYSHIGISRYNSLYKNDFSNSEIYSAKATVIRCKGNFDADIRETFEYTEYYSNEKILSIENWSEEIEYSYGKEIELEDIVLGGITDSKSNKFFNKSNLVNPKIPVFIIGLILITFISFIFFIPSRIFTSYCSPTCSRYDRDWCCIDVNECMVTHKVCKSMYYNNTSSIRHGSSGVRNPIGGGTSFGK